MINKIILNSYTCSKCKCNIKNIKIEVINNIEYFGKNIYTAKCSNCGKKSIFTLKRKRYYFFEKEKSINISDVLQPAIKFLKEMRQKREKELLDIKRNIKIRELIK